MTAPAPALAIDRIAAAVAVIDPIFLDTPQFVAESLAATLDCDLVVKVETANPIRSFKARGTETLVAATGNAHLVCTTAGNFGQGMAFSARKRGVPLTIFAATTANPRKVERMRAFGAEVHLVGEQFDDAHAAARAFAAEHGARFVEDGRDREISEGAGTIGIELARWPEPLDALVIPLGDGALLAGVATWFRAHSPTTQIFGVCPTEAPAMARSWRAQRVIAAPSRSIADGIGVTTPIAESVALLLPLADDVLLVAEDMLREAMQLAHDELGLVLEPSGAAGIAAVLQHGAHFTGRRVATVLTGSNV